MTIGRPSEYSIERAERICELIVDKHTLNEICVMEDMPGMTTLFRWLDKHEDFRKLYARAKELQIEAFMDELPSIADDGSNDFMERFDKEGQSLGYFVNGEHVQRSRLRIEARKWLASKLKPKKYGDALTMRGDADNPIVTKDATASDKRALAHFVKHYADRANLQAPEEDDGADLV